VLKDDRVAFAFVDVGHRVSRDGAVLERREGRWVDHRAWLLDRFGRGVGQKRFQGAIGRRTHGFYKLLIG
jgi:hypothetical protein